MSTSMRTNWWVVLTAALGAFLLATGLAIAVIGSSGTDTVFGLVGAAVAAISGGLLLGGLVRRRTSVIVGSQMVVVGALLTLVGGLELVPIGIVVLISGFWSGNLQLSESADSPDLRPVGQYQIDMTRFWWVWLTAAAMLFAIGWLPLIFDDPDDLSPGGWSVWVLSWLGAIVTGGIGVILGGLRLFVRHRTRLA